VRPLGPSDRTAPRETWTLARMAQDVSDLAASLGLAGGYATLDHSYGAIVVLQHVADHPGEPRGTIVPAGIAAAWWLLAAAPPGGWAGRWSRPGRRLYGAGESGAAALTCARRPRR
jgi:pimeloyl-ACP methyl ester carboxylesterase